MAIGWQNVAYNQPPHPGFFLGASDATGAMSAAPTPNIYLVQADLIAPTASGEFEFDARQAVHVHFNELMDTSSLSITDMVLHPLSGAPDVSPMSVTYDTDTRIATFLFAAILPDDNYRATLLSGSVTDLAGNALAADFSFDFFVLSGDANRDRTVDITDLGILATNWQQSPRSFSEGDFNYDSIVDITDLGTLATRWQVNLPAVGAVGAVGGDRVSGAITFRDPLQSPLDAVGLG
jgi:hypothetical protein